MFRPLDAAPSQLRISAPRTDIGVTVGSFLEKSGPTNQPERRSVKRTFNDPTDAAVGIGRAPRFNRSFRTTQEPDGTFTITEYLMSTR